MTIQGKNLFVNYASLLSGTIVSKIVAMIGIFMLSRFLGVSGFGEYSLVFSYMALMNALVDIGGTSLLNRELSLYIQDSLSPRGLVESVIYLRMLGGIIFIPLGILLANPMGVGTVWASIAALGVVLSTETLFDAYFSARGRLDLSALTRLCASLINLGMLILCIVMHASLITIILVTTVSPLGKLLWDILWSSRFQWRIGPPNWPLIGSLAKDGWALWLMGFQYIILARIDTVLLQSLSPHKTYDIGIYSAAYRFSEILSLAVTSLSPAILPLLMRAKASNDAQRVYFLSKTCLQLILMCLIPISQLVFWYAPMIISLVYGKNYSESAVNLQILILSQSMVAVNTIAYLILLTYNIQGKKSVLIASTMMMLLNIVLNLFLIPSYRSVGASLATVITELVTLSTLLYFIDRYTGNPVFKNILLMGFLGALCMTPPFFLGASWGFVSPVLFLALIFGSGVITVEKIRQFATER